MEDRYQEPAVASFTKRYIMGQPTLAAQCVADSVANALAEVASQVRENHFLVGHVKAFVEMTPGGDFRLSVVKGAAKVQSANFEPQARPLAVEAAITAIVYGPSVEELQALIESTLNRCLPGQLIARDLKGLL